MKSKNIYNFDVMSQRKDGGYIIQLVKNRKLSEIYHSHDFYEIVFVIKGTALHKVNGAVNKMQEGDGVLLLPGDAHCFLNQSDDLCLMGLSVKTDEFKRISLSFDVNIPNSSDFKGEALNFYCKKEVNELKRIFEALKESNEIIRISNCRLILCIFINSLIASVKNDCKNIPEFLKNAVSKMYLPENCAGGVRCLTELTKYSYSHLFRLIEKYYGKTPHELVFEIKMNFAYNRVINSDDVIEFISESVGYKSLSHFNTAFKKQYGITPGSLRRKNKEMSSI